MVRVRKNNILAKNRLGKRALGCGLDYPSLQVLELIGMVGGFDYVHLDGEHGSFSSEAVDAVCRAADGYGLTVTARVPNLDDSIINTYLDRGVMGIVGPHVETAEDAQALARACRFAPEGERSWGGGRGTFYNDTGILQLPDGERTEFMSQTNREMIVIAQLETVTAFENVDSIMGVEGVDCFTWGPNDLAQSMGYPGQPNHPEAVEARRKTADRIHAAGRKLLEDLMVSANATSLVLDGIRDFLAKNQ